MMHVHEPRRITESSPFKGRGEMIKDLLQEKEEVAPLYNVYGVAGIGKTRLLAETKRRLKEKKPKAVLIWLDLTEVQSDGRVPPEAFMRALVKQKPSLLRGPWANANQMAAEVVESLDESASGPNGEVPVYLFVDTTEVAQGDMEFWGWLEENLVSPLLLSRKVRQVFAGRVPAPWRRFEIRRDLKLIELGPLLIELGPLPSEASGRELLFDVLAIGNPALTENEIEQAVPLLAELSFGHPLLSEQLAAYAARLLPKALEDPLELQRMLCNKVVYPFENTFLFEGVPDDWIPILRWASVLRQFDPLLLRRYLEKAGVVTGKPEFFFIQGLARRRKQDAIVGNVGEGMAVNGILRDIVRQSFRIRKPADYRRACEAAAAVFRELAEQLPDESVEAQQCLDDALYYETQFQTAATSKEES